MRKPPWRRTALGLSWVSWKREEESALGWLQVQKISVYLSMSPPYKYLIFTYIGINGVLSVFNNCPYTYTHTRTQSVTCDIGQFPWCHYSYHGWSQANNITSRMRSWEGVHRIGSGYNCFAHLVQGPLNSHFKAAF